MTDLINLAEIWNDTRSKDEIFDDLAQAMDQNPVLVELVKSIIKMLEPEAESDES